MAATMTVAGRFVLFQDWTRMGKAPAEQFYWNDWARDLEEHPLEIEGAWIRICCKLWYEQPRGRASKTMEQWAKLLGVQEDKARDILTYIGSEKIGNVTLGSKKVTVTCRRMDKKERERKSNRDRQMRLRRRRNAQHNAESNGDVTSYLQSSASGSNSSEPPPTPTVTVLEGSDFDEDFKAVGLPPKYWTEFRVICRDAILRSEKPVRYQHAYARKTVQNAMEKREIPRERRGTGGGMRSIGEVIGDLGYGQEEA